METFLSSPPRSWQLLTQRTLSTEDGAGLQADMSFTRWFRDVELVCAAPCCDVGPHSLAKARARAALAGGWGGTGMATVPPRRTGAWHQPSGMRSSAHTCKVRTLQTGVAAW